MLGHRPEALGGLSNDLWIQKENFGFFVLLQLEGDADVYRRSAPNLCDRPEHLVDTPEDLDPVANMQSVVVGVLPRLHSGLSEQSQCALLDQGG